VSIAFGIQARFGNSWEERVVLVRPAVRQGIRRRRKQMSFRRRHRWLRRLALGLALVTAASLGGASSAAAKRDDGPGNAVYVSGHGQALAPLAASPFRPDDLADRFAHSDVAAAGTPSRAGSWTFRRSDALVLAVGGLALAFGLALALGYIRRPRLAGL
jgi:hypothetical protein